MSIKITARPRSLIFWGSLLAAGLLIAQGSYIHLKALLAQYLLEAAWNEVQAGQPNSPPWPWADTRPVARLKVPHLEIEQIILAGDSPRNLAFGPGHNLATPAPGRIGHSLISAHRDTHFAFLRQLQQGDPLVIETPQGEIQHFHVFHRQVTEQSRAQLPGGDEHSYIHLVTCYPFDAIDPGTSQRYIVSARRLSSAPENTRQTATNRPVQRF